MKKIAKTAGVVLIVCAVLLFIIAMIGDEAAQGTKVSTGVMINGKYTEINSGYMGYNAKAKEDLGWLKGIAIISGLAGAGSIIGSGFIKDEDPPNY